jgi:radical SAM superfamily enzyme YgiQ (UPF0313 family)
VTVTTAGKADLVIIVPPAGVKNTVYPPYGAMFIASAVRKMGLVPAIINVDTERISNGLIIERLRQISPKYIGFSGIVAPSYKYIKALSRKIKEKFPDRIQILGGGLSSAAGPILENTPIDYVVAGEGDRTIVELLDALENGKSADGVAGMYIRDGKGFRHTGTRRLIARLDEIDYPAFDLIDMDRYMPDGVEFIRNFIPDVRDSRILDPGRSRKMMTIPTSRGCFGKCSFCFRAYPGIRVNSIKYVFDLIEYCIDKFGAGFFSLGDECFAPNKQRNWEFIEEYKRRKMDFIFRILGMRVDTVDKDILKAYKEIGCWMIEYGFEAGNQKMLNIIDKRVTVEQNRQAALWTAQAGIYTSPTLVLAMPGETDKTVSESVDFIKSLSLGYKQYQWSYALPIPGSPLYEFARLSGAVEDEDEYLDSLDGKVAGAGIFHVNLTDEPDEIVASWADKIRMRIDDAYLRRRYGSRALAAFMAFAEKIKVHLAKKDLGAVIANKLRSFTVPAAPSQASERPVVKFRKKQGFVFEELIKGMDDTVVNRNMALCEINARLKKRGEGDQGPL